MGGWPARRPPCNDLPKTASSSQLNFHTEKNPPACTTPSWQNTNPLIGAYPGAIGVKTGDTKAAGNCLLFEATRNGLTLVGVALGTPGDDITVTGPVATRVLNWGFSRF
jgi:serine-type D-Ala-D-Ala carboxypeptidase (penicillin-binding protein 5/6)